ncbi:MAG: hypothetical protein JWQ09_241 [Segetibacter sp.]|nr:hypothetical protein [Segetibacter sp.]
MYQDYFNDVIKYYRIGERNADLPQRLMRPTPAGIKAECESAYKSRFQKIDLRTLSAFFAIEKDTDGMLRVIKRCETDRFRPLVNFLKGKTSTTDHLNIELLAWLIDFPNRPYKDDYSTASQEAPADIVGRAFVATKVGSHVEGELKFEKEDTGVEKVTEREFQEVRKYENKKGGLIAFLNIRQKLVFGVVGVVLLTLLGFYIVTGNSKPQQCMVWVVDHYEPTSCEPKPGGAPIVALDQQKIKNFRMISRSEAIKIAAVGKLWYIKREGNIEYYTAGGSHPIEQYRDVKPITKYMIETHLIPPSK